MFLIISKQVIKMSLIILVGIACRKTGIVTHEGNKTLSNLLLRSDIHRSSFTACCSPCFWQ